MIETNLYIIWVFIFVFTILNLIRYAFIIFKAMKNDTVLNFSRLEIFYIGINLNYFITYLFWLF